MNGTAYSITTFFSKSWDTWTLVLLVIGMTLLPQAIFPLSKSRLIICLVLIVIGHFNKHKFGVRIGFMLSGFGTGMILPFI